MPPTSSLGQLPWASSTLRASCVPRAPIVVPRSSAAFSTSAVQYKSPQNLKKNASTTGPPKKGVKSLRITKKKPSESSGRKTAPGEARALRRRIVLSNSNALEVSDLRELEATSVGDTEFQNECLGIPDAVVDQLRVVEAFKPNQGWSLFRRPAVLMRQEAVELGQTISSVQADGKKTIRRVITGERASGKTVLLLQAMSMAFLKGWVVINFPDAMQLTDGQSAYAPLEGTTPTQYVQKVYTAQLLGQISKANEEVLQKLQLSQKHNLPIPVPEKTTLARLAQLGAQDPDLAWPVLQALWKELIKPNKEADTPELKRPPILICMDNLSFIMNNSEYLNRDANPIHAHDLVLVRHFTDLLSGARNLSNGGIVLAATSGSNSPKSAAMEFGIKLNEERQAGATDAPQWNPYVKLDERSLKSLNNVDVTRLKGLSRDEARSIIEYYAASGLVRKVVDENLVSEKWTVSGGGIIGELERSTVRYRI